MNVYVGNRLPSTYQEVEYIQSTGNQYIDTGYNYNGTYFRIDFQLMFNSYSYGGTGADLPTMTGVIGRSYGNMFMSLNPDTHVFGFATGTQYETNFVAQLGTIYETMLEYKSGTMKMKINNSEFSTSSSGTFYTGKSIPLFCRWDIQYSGLYSYFCTDMRMYGCKIYSAENVLARDFVPCYRKSDNVIGLYDLANNQFYTNSGTGTFSKGSDVLTNATLKNAYIGEYGWTPGSNTVAYYPLTANGNDNSGNGKNLTNLGSTSFGTKGNVPCAIFSASTTSGLYNNSVAVPQGSAAWTANLYVYPTSYNSSEEDAFFFGTNSSNQGFLIYNINPLSISSWGAAVDSTNNITLNTWSNIVITQSSKTYNIYINGVLVKSGTMSSANLTGTNFNIGYAYGNNSAVKRFIGGISEFIFENKARTTQEISDYYNQTKSNYGL